MDTTPITIADLDAETAEYLPSREVMWCYGGRKSQTSTTNTNVAVVGSNDGNVHQSANQFGLINVGNVAIGNGSFDGGLVGQL